MRPAPRLGKRAKRPGPDPGARRPERRRNPPAIATMPCQTDCDDYIAAHRTGPIAHGRENSPPSAHVIAPCSGARGFPAGRYAGVAEWLKAHAWKACLRETLTWVRIPPPPPCIYNSLVSSSTYVSYL